MILRPVSEANFTDKFTGTCVSSLNYVPHLRLRDIQLHQQREEAAQKQTQADPSRARRAGAGMAGRIRFATPPSAPGIR